MNSNKVCRLWANMVAQMDISMIVPQHGRCMTGKAIPEFIAWIKELQCGIDLMTENDYQVP
jgi:flavorubredoxin